MARKPSMKSLAPQVDRLGDVKAMIADLEEEKKEITQLLKDTIPVGATLEGKKFKATLQESPKRILNVKKVLKLLGMDKFLSIATVAITKLEKMVGAEDVDKVTDGYTEGTTLRTKKIKKG